MTRQELTERLRENSPGVYRPATCSAVVVELKMIGGKRNCAKVQRIIESAINETLSDMSWSFTGSGKVEVEWKISSQNSQARERDSVS